MYSEQTPSQQKLSMSQRRAGKHLLPLNHFDHKVTVRAAPVDPNLAHLYPKLVGVDWECHITGSKVILGRSVDRVGAHQDRTSGITVELGTDQMISRRHAVIQYNNTKQRWELKVYGVNGVELNRKHITSKSPPVELSPGTLIQIVQQKFLFISAGQRVADHHQLDPPSTPVLSDTTSVSTAYASQILESLVVETLRSTDKENLSTLEVLTNLSQQKVQEGFSSMVYTQLAVLETLIRSPKCLVDDDSLMLPTSEADNARWMLAPQYDGCNGLPWRRPVASRGTSIEAIYSLWQRKPTKRGSDTNEQNPNIWKAVRTTYLFGSLHQEGSS